MNWTEIKEKAPKALRSAEDKLYTEDHPNHPDHGRISRVRDLFDLFDERGIYCIVYPEKKHAELWEWDIERENKATVDAQEKCSSRKQAEIAVFTKAFELLEERL